MTFRVRAALAFAAVAAGLGADYWFVHRPEPHSVAEFNPVTVTLGKEELTLQSPTPVGKSLLSHQGGKNEVVEIFFDSGKLAPATRRLLAAVSWAQSEKAQKISYTTLDTTARDAADAKGPTCRTFFDVKPDDKTIDDLRVFQDGIAGGEDHREFSIKSQKRIRVEFLTAPEDSEHANEPGCSKLLQAGDHQVPLGGMIPVAVVSEANAAVRFKFMPASSTPLWKGSKGLYEPFQGTSLKAKSVRVSPIGSAQQLFFANAPAGDQWIGIDELLAGSDLLQTRLSGTAWVAVNGHPVSPTLGEWISASGLRAGLTGLLNVLVFCGAILFALKSGSGRWTPPPGPDDPAPATPPGLMVFLCHCSEDKPAVREVDRILKAAGFQPWLDEEDIRPARQWNNEIRESLRRSHAVVVCLSKTFTRKEGYVQKELRFAIDLADEKLDQSLFLIPIRLEDCELLPSLAKWQMIDWFQPAGREKLVRVLRERAKQVGIEPAASNANA